jgi:hypothetical protein
MLFEDLLQKLEKEVQEFNDTLQSVRICTEVMPDDMALCC